MSELPGISDGGNILSESNNLWDFLLSVVLHLSEFVVLHVELVPQIVVDVDDGSFVWIFTYNPRILIGLSIEFHSERLDLVHLILVLKPELLDLWSWSSLMHGLNVLAEPDELWRVHHGLNLLLKLLAVGRF